MTMSARPEAPHAWRAAPGGLARGARGERARAAWPERNITLIACSRPAVAPDRARLIATPLGEAPARR
jgi:hypothetical protein